MTDADYALGLEQGSAEWLAFKVGKVGASRIADITARLRSGAPGASRATYLGELISERLTGVTANGYSNAAMDWGKACEAQARARYAFENLCTVERVGIVVHPAPELLMSLASPDGLVGRDGLVEIKCPHVTNNHIEVLLGADIPGRYLQQMQWQLACTGRAWCDYVSFDPRMPPPMQIKIIRVERDEQTIGGLEDQVEAFLAEIADKVDELRQLYETAPSEAA